MADNLETFDIHDRRILRRIAEQARAARKGDGVDDEYSRYIRLCFYHLELSASVLEYQLELEERQ